MSFWLLGTVKNNAVNSIFDWLYHILYRIEASYFRDTPGAGNAKAGPYFVQTETLSVAGNGAGESA